MVWFGIGAITFGAAFVSRMVMVNVSDTGVVRPSVAVTTMLSAPVKFTGGMPRNVGPAGSNFSHVGSAAPPTSLAV